MRYLPKPVTRVRFPSPALNLGRPRSRAYWRWRVDAHLFAEACQYRWHPLNAGHWRYRNGEHDPSFLLHNWVMEQAYGAAPAGCLTTDHIDGDPSNNCLANLRPATKQLQMLNKRGVTGATPDGKGWKARLRGKHLGTFATRKEAEAAYSTAKSEAIHREIAESWRLYGEQLAGRVCA